MLVTVGFAFLAGIITVLSPCVLPLLPVILGSATQEGKARPIGLIIGFVGTFTAATLALSFLVRALGVEQVAGHVHPDAAVLLLEVLWQLPVGHQVEHLELHASLQAS